MIEFLDISCKCIAPFLVDELEEPSKGSVIRIEQQLHQTGELRRAVPAVAAVHHDRLARAENGRHALGGDEDACGVAEPLRALQEWLCIRGGVRLAHGCERIVRRPHAVNVGNVTVVELRVGVVAHVLGAFALGKVAGSCHLRPRVKKVIGCARSEQRHHLLVGLSRVAAKARARLRAATDARVRERMQPHDGGHAARAAIRAQLDNVVVCEPRGQHKGLGVRREECVRFIVDERPRVGVGQAEPRKVRERIVDRWRARLVRVQWVERRTRLDRVEMHRAKRVRAVAVETKRRFNERDARSFVRKRKLRSKKVLALHVKDVGRRHRRVVD